METIYSLRRKGYKVRVVQFRNFKRRGDSEICSYTKNELDNSDNAFTLLSKGGLTHIDITTPLGETASGEAVCSIKDLYNRRLGNTIALGRALKKLD